VFAVSDEDKLTGKIDLIICLGGDGTLLYASTLFQVKSFLLNASHFQDLWHIWCLFQGRINWEGYVRKGIWHKNGGDGRVELVWMGCQSIWLVGASACVIFILHQKIQKMAQCTFWYWLTRVVLDKVQRAIRWWL